MNKTLSIQFNILGNLDPGLVAALRNAQNQLKGLGKFSSALKVGEKIQDAFKLNGAIAQFKAMQRAIGNTAKEISAAKAKSANLKKEFTEQDQKLAEMRKAHEQLKRVWRENKSSMSPEQKAAMQSAMAAAKEEIAAQKAKVTASAKNITTNDATISRLQNQLTQQHSQFSELRSALRSAGVSAAQMAQSESQLQAAIARTNQELTRQINLAQRREHLNTARQNLSNATSNFQDSLGTAGTILSPIKSAVEEAVTFEQAMSKVKALTQVKNIRAGDTERVNREMAQMTEEIQRVAAGSEFSQVEVAQMAQKYAMSGWKPEQILAALQPVIDLATATGESDVVKIADMVSDEMQALNLKAGGKVTVGGKTYDAMKHMTDVFAYANNQSNVDANAFHEAMKYNAPIATAAGVNMHEIAALNMVMANSAIKGSMGGTAGRSGIMRLVAPPKQAAKALEEMGMTASDAQKAVAEAGATMQEFGIKEGDSVTTKIQKIQQALSGLDDQARTAKLDKIFGKNAASGWAAVMAHYDDYLKYMQDFDSGVVEGWTQDTAGVMRDNTATQFKLLESAISAVATTFGSLFLPAVSQGASMLTNLASGLNQWIQQNQGLARAIGVTAAAVAGLIVAIAGFGVVSTAIAYVSASFGLLKLRVLESVAAFRAMSFASITSQLSAMGTAIASVGRAAMGFAFSPIGIALMALAMAGYYCYTHWSQVAPVFQSLAATLGGSLQGAITAIGAAFETLGSSISRLGPAFSNIGGVIFGALAVGLNAVVNIASTIISTFANAIAAVISLFGGLGNAIASALAGNWSQAAEQFKNAFVNAGKFIVEAIKSLFGGIADTFMNFFKPLEIMGATQNKSSGGGSFGTPQQVEQKITHEVQVNVDALSTALANAQSQNPQADLSQLQATISSALAEIKSSPENAEQISAAVSTAIESAQQNQQVDLSGVMEAFTATVSTMQAQQVEQQPPDFLPLQEAVNAAAVPLTEMGNSSQLFNAEMANAQAANAANNAELQNSVATNAANNAQLQAVQGALSGFNAALSSTNGGLASLASSSSSAASAISGLGSAASSAVSALQSAGANAAAAVSAAAASVGKPAANFKGGIYSKGAFLTTFAEKSPEAAIPIEKTQRATDLWTKTGQLLGLLPGNSIAIESSPQEQKISTIERAQRQRLEQVKAQYEKAKNSIAIESPKLPISEWMLGKPTFPEPKNSIAIESPKIPVMGKPTFPEQKEMPRSIFNGRAQTPMPEIFSDFDIFGALRDKIPESAGGLLDILQEKIFPSEGIISSTNNQSETPINLRFEINIAGNANAADVEAGIRQTIPLLEETFENKIASWRHEKQRREF